MRTGLRTLWYKLKHQYVLRNVSFGAHTVVGCRLSIKGPGRISIGSGCTFTSDPWGDDLVSIYTHTAGARVVIGDQVLLRATRFGCRIAITIGSHAILDCASVFDSDFHSADVRRWEAASQERDRAVTIGEGSYVGCECLCSKGTVLGERVTLLPGTVIGTKTIPPDSVVSGNPARVLARGGREAPRAAGPPGRSDGPAAGAPAP